MKIYEAIADAIAVEAQGYVFGVLGDANMTYWSALCDDPRVNVVSARHEANAVLMALAMAEARSLTGVATLTCGPGLTHAATSILTASRANAPIVIVTSDPGTADRNSIQVLDQAAFARACDAEFHFVSRPDALADGIREAFYAAKRLHKPVLLSFPMAWLEENLAWDWSYVSSATFAPALAPLPSAEDMAALADALLKAERPVLVAGRGAMHAKRQLSRLGDQIGAILTTSLLAKGLFDGLPFNAGISGSFSSAPTEALLTEADMVLAVGASLNFFTTEGGLLFPEAEIARIDIAPLPRSMGLGGRYLNGEAARTLDALSEVIERRGSDQPRIGYRSGQTLALLASGPAPEDPPTDGLDPRQLMRELAGALPDGTQVVCGGGHFWAFPIMHMALPPRGRMRFSCHFGSIGQALGMGIGTSFAFPDSLTVIVEGDGGLLQSLQELHSIVENKLPIIVLVMNDGGYGAEVHKMRAKGLNGRTARWTSPDFVGIAKSFGCAALRLNDEVSIGAEVRRAVESRLPLLIDARISPSALSDSYRKLYFGIPNQAPLPVRS